MSEDLEPAGHSSHSVSRAIRHAAEQLTRAWRRLSWEARILGSVWIVFLGLTIFLSYQRYLTYQTNAWDLGINMQALWTTGFQGRFLYYTADLSWNSSGSVMGVHFAALLLFLTPIYRAFPTALTLFVLQSAVVCLSSLPLYLLAVRRSSRPAALAISLAYLFSAPLLGGLFFDFHSEAFVPLFGLTVWYSWETRKPRLLALSGVALLSVIEFTPIILGAIAFMFLVEGLWTWKVKRRVVGRPYLRWMVQLPLVVLAACAILTPIWFTIPRWISPSLPPASQAGVLGGSLSQILVNLFNPVLVGQALSVDGHTKLVYLAILVLAGLMLWVLSPRQLIPAVPWTAVALLSAYPGYVLPVGDQYAFLGFPFLLPASASGYSIVKNWIRRARRSGGAVAPGSLVPNRRGPTRRWRLPSERVRTHAPQVGLACLLFAGFAYTQVYWSPLSPVSGNWERVYQGPSAKTQELNTISQLVPSSASISAEPDLFPQFANRADAYPFIVPGVEYIFFDTSNWWFTSPLPPPSTNPPWSEEVKNISGTYGVLASSNGAILLEKGFVGEPIVFTPIDRTLGPASFSFSNATLVQSSESPDGAYASPRPGIGYRWHTPSVFVEPGVYSVSLWLREVEPGLARMNATATLAGQNIGNVSWDVAPSGAAWELVSWSIDVRYPAQLEVAGFDLSPFLDLEFGGGQLSELCSPAEAT